VDEDEGNALETARGMVAYFAVVYYYDFLFELAGYGDVRREVARGNKERGFLEAIKLVPDDLIRKLSIVGTPAQCRQRLQELRAAGLELAILNAPGPRRVFGQPVRVPVDPQKTCGAIVHYLAD
jgi:alkanesulfonate monooxygenase SsuD/methylene tetrahydromethanopterin reductase-like flavin-dependent oxidoreductase (luciferase family)